MCATGCGDRICTRCRSATGKSTASVWMSPVRETTCHCFARLCSFAIKHGSQVEPISACRAQLILEHFCFCREPVVTGFICLIALRGICSMSLHRLGWPSAQTCSSVCTRLRAGTRTNLTQHLNMRRLLTPGGRESLLWNGVILAEVLVINLSHPTTPTRRGPTTSHMCSLKVEGRWDEALGVAELKPQTVTICDIFSLPVSTSCCAPPQSHVL